MLNTTFVFGLLSIFQAIFLPGYLFLKLLRLKTDKLTQAILSFSLSMVLNYFIVLIMVVLGIFTTLNIRILFFLELIIFFAFIYKEKYTYNLKNWLKNLSNYEIIAIGLLIYAAVFSIIHLFGTFTDCDAVGSWNKWALEWYNGSIPDSRSAGGPYPQVITACAGIIYRMTGTPLQFFAYFSLSTFVFFSILITYSLAKHDTENKKQWFLSVIGVTFFVSLVMREVGQADTPVAFMGFAVFYAIYILKFNNDISKLKLYKHLLIITLLIGGTTITKQAGWYILLVSPIFMWFYIFKNEKYNLKFILTCTSTALIIALAIAATWYLYIIYLNTYSQNFNYLVHLTDKFGFFHKMGRFRYSNAAILIISIILAWRYKVCRWISILIIIPFFIIWYNCFGYDKRNVSLLLPFSGVVFGFAIYQIIIFVNKFKQTKLIQLLTELVNFICQQIGKRILSILISIYQYPIKNKKILYSSLSILVLIALFCPLFSYNNIDTFHTYRIISTLGGRNPSKIRKKIYYMDKNNELKGRIYTNFQYERWLPESFKKVYIISDSWQNAIPSDKLVKEKKIKYLFIAWSSKNILEKLNNMIVKNKIKFLSKNRDFYLYEYTN